MQSQCSTIYLSLFYLTLSAFDTSIKLVFLLDYCGELFMFLFLLIVYR